MTLLYEREILDPKEFYLRDPAPELVSWQGREALRLSGQGACLALLPELCLAQGRIEVDIAAEGMAYPGIVFRASDTHNYELAYAQPHTSGKWDALQYDPVFHGSNTWQLYHGPGAHQVAQVPLNDWFRLSVEFRGHAGDRAGGGAGAAVRPPPGAWLPDRAGGLVDLPAGLLLQLVRLG